MAKHNLKILRCSHREKFLKYVWPFYILHERVKLSPVAKRSQRSLKLILHSRLVQENGEHI